jgi:phosphatidyl-myo-inositol alpha-mannosyltransferase
VKVGIVVPFSWSFWGAVVEHAELQAESLRRLGVDTRTIMGSDPPGSFTRVLHPRLGRHERPPVDVISAGRSVIVPANGSLPNIVLSPWTLPRVRRALARERFDVLHVHEPMTPAICVAALSLVRCPVVATWHAAGDLRWNRGAVHFWGFLMDRIDYRIAVSEQARRSAERYHEGPFDVIPNGVLIPPSADPGGREHHLVFVGRHDPRKGLPVLLRAWPEIRRRTGARLRLAGADPLAVRLLLARERVVDDGVDVLGLLSQEELTRELCSAKALIAPSVGMESFGMVLTRAFACALPVVASDIPGYRDVTTGDTGILVAPGDPSALTDAVVALLSDEGRRRGRGEVARRLAVERYSWDLIARRLLGIYQRVTGAAAVRETAEAVPA